MPPRDTRRPDRVAEAVRGEVAAFLATGVKDPRVVGLVTVTAVEMTRDLGAAIIYVSIYGTTDEERARTMTGLQSVALGLRGRVGRALKLRVAPHINFKQDESIARAARIETLLSGLRPAPDVEPQAGDAHGEPPDDGR
jgi:ribosome-binding factor A